MKRSWLLILPIVLLTLSPSIVGLRSEGQYVHFGYVPAKIQDGGECRIYIVGNQDATRVSVYSIPELETLADFVVDRLEVRTVQVPSGSMFKVVSSKQTTVILAGGRQITAVNASISTFYTSVEGGYLGKEFIFTTFHNEEGSGVYTVYALEKADVSVFDSTGAEVNSFELATNGFRDFGLEASEVHRLVSSGYVMLQSFSEKAPVGWMTVWKSHSVPSLEGTFAGSHFYARGVNPGWQAGGALPGLSFMYTSAQDAGLRIYDLKERTKAGEERMAAGENRSFYFFQQHYFFETSEPTALALLANGGGLIAGGLRDGEAAYIYVPSDESLLFAYARTLLSLDEVQYSLSPNDVLRLPTGLHKIEADNTVLFVMVHYASQNRWLVLGLSTEASETSLDCFGACLPSVQSLELEYTDVKISSLEAGTPWLLYAEAGAAAALVIIVVIFIVKKTRPR